MRLSLSWRGAQQVQKGSWGSPWRRRFFTDIRAMPLTYQLRGPGDISFRSWARSPIEKITIEWWNLVVIIVNSRYNTYTHYNMYCMSYVMYILFIWIWCVWCYDILWTDSFGSRDEWQSAPESDNIPRRNKWTSSFHGEWRTGRCARLITLQKMWSRRRAWQKE